MNPSALKCLYVLVNFKVLGPQLFLFLPNQSAISGFTSYIVQPDPTIHPFNPSLAKAINFIIFNIINNNIYYYYFIPAFSSGHGYLLNPFWINSAVGFSLIYLKVWGGKKITRLSKLILVMDISGDRAMGTFHSL